MRNFLSRYYFISRRELKIRTFKLPPAKSIFPVIVTFFVFQFIILLTSGFFPGVSGDNENSSGLAVENAELKKQLTELKEEIARVNGRLSTVISLNNEIREIADLPRMDEDLFKIDNTLASYELTGGLASASYGSLEDASKLLKLLENNLELQSRINKEISTAFVDKTGYLRGIPSIKPLDASFNRTSFGPRKNPITGRPQFHTGLDMGSTYGQEIFASADGIVERADNFSGYGLCVIIAHASGYKTLYGHCSKLLVKKGDKISRGELIALVGSTGLSTGPHLHYEVIYNGEHLNPADFFFDEEKANFDKKSKK
ncbi:MAG: M23 family metallopeptidase [Bacteroidetes bacterium]|nr:M23 family metallopeptidase [Bacteroidota bacterium]